MTNIIKLEFKDKKLNNDELATKWLLKTEEKLNETFEDVISKAWMDLALYGNSILKDGKHIPICDVLELNGDWDKALNQEINKDDV